MIWIILQLIFCSMPFMLSLALYKSRRRFMANFYDAMTRSTKARKLYVQVLLILLLLFHYVHKRTRRRVRYRTIHHRMCRYVLVQTGRQVAAQFARPATDVCQARAGGIGHRFRAASVHDGRYNYLSSFGCLVLSLRSGFVRME